jgi:hypothetical protein
MRDVESHLNNDNAHGRSAIPDADDAAQEGNKVAQAHKRFFKVHWFMMESCCEVQLPRERREYKHGKTIALHQVRPVVVFQVATCAPCFLR